MSAGYSGDANSASTSPAVSVTVSAPAKAATTTSLSASATQLTAGQHLTFSAAVVFKSGTGTPTGMISFLDGPTQIGSATLTSGAASFTTANLAVGDHTLSASYSGDSNYAASNSIALAVTITAQPRRTIPSA